LDLRYQNIYLSQLRDDLFGLVLSLAHSSVFHLAKKPASGRTAFLGGQATAEENKKAMQQELLQTKHENRPRMRFLDCRRSRKKLHDPSPGRRKPILKWPFRNCFQTLVHIAAFRRYGLKPDLRCTCNVPRAHVARYPCD
jgi:hypothetical protein